MDVETDVSSWHWARDYKDYKLQKINGQKKGRAGREREGKRVDTQGHFVTPVRKDWAQGGGLHCT